MSNTQNKFGFQNEQWNRLDPTAQQTLNEIFPQLQGQRKTFMQGVEFPKECQGPQMDQAVDQLTKNIALTIVQRVSELQAH